MERGWRRFGGTGWGPLRQSENWKKLQEIYRILRIFDSINVVINVMSIFEWNQRKVEGGGAGL